MTQVGFYTGCLQQLVLQPTPFCNLACTYCYLPHRDEKASMSPEVLDAAFCFVRDARLSSDNLELRWHAGEPLAVPLQFYEDAFIRAKRILGSQTVLHHSIQTNAVLLNADWANFFKLNNVRIGISIDGPSEIHDARRLTRKGGGTFHKVMQGIKWLQACNLSFDVIAVITPQTLRYPSAFMDFFADLEGMNQLGLNVEETEGSHISEAFSKDNFESNFRDFLENLMRWSRKTGITVREFQSMRSRILNGAGSAIRNTQNEPFTILTISSNGDMVTFSPELQGMIHPIFGNFSIGNVLLNTPNSVSFSPSWFQMAADISYGKALCRANCSYFSVCGGGAPINKLYENHSFATMQTQHCLLTVKSIADVVLSAMEREAGIEFVPEHL